MTKTMPNDEDLSVIVTIVQGNTTLIRKFSEAVTRDDIIEETDNLLNVLYGDRNDEQT